jgi:hypothetical protein
MSSSPPSTSIGYAGFFWGDAAAGSAGEGEASPPPRGYHHELLVTVVLAAAAAGVEGDAPPWSPVLHVCALLPPPWLRPVHAAVLGRPRALPAAKDSAWAW